MLDRLVELGALDVDRSPGGGIAALLPDSVAPEQVAHVLGVDDHGRIRLSRRTALDVDPARIEN